MGPAIPDPVNKTPEQITVTGVMSFQSSLFIRRLDAIGPTQRELTKSPTIELNPF